MNKKLIFIAGIAALILLGHYGSFIYETQDQVIQSFINSSEYQNKQIWLKYIKIIKADSIAASGIDGRQRSYIFFVNNKQLQIGKVYALELYKNHKGHLQLISFKEYPLRKAKYITSSLSILLIFYLVIKFLRFDKMNNALYINPSSEFI
ncbi:MAG: hypothetical protein JXR46_05520 [Calditrichaceae bacterium]|nr:hypothetical protein [Calditrichaceae bacterium]MBN2708485.1 hypothetical protein [Calditrichaceae bacterium]RQV91956.1 MAG: hypothetical protein EH224_16870 [Calditrichota bacterium]